MINQGKSQKRNKMLMTLPVLLVLLGLSLLLYPLVSDTLARIERGQVIDSFEQTIAAQGSAALDAQLVAARNYNARLVNSEAMITDPFDPNAQVVRPEEYMNLLNLRGDGVMALLTIPKIKVQLPIYHGVSNDSLQHGVGHLESTSLPVGGASTHTVLSAHTGLPTAILFDHLDQLTEGDRFTIEVAGQVLTYAVTSTEVVLPEETSSLRIFADKDLCTLVTCTPYGVNSHRLLVHAERIATEDDYITSAATRQDTTGIYWYYAGLLAGVVLMGLLVVLLLVWRRRRNKHSEQPVESCDSYTPRHLKM